MSLLALPRELVLQIADWLSESELTQTIRVCRGLSDVLQPILYHRGLRYGPNNEPPALVWAVREDRVGTVENVYRYTSPGPLLQNQALVRAATSSNYAMTQLLLDHGAPPDPPLPQDQPRDHDLTNRIPTLTPLLRAARHANVQLVEMLLAAGADPNRYTLDDRARMLTLSSQSGDTRIATSLLTHGLQLPRDSFLPFLVRRGCSEALLHLLLTAGHDINARDTDSGRTALFLAITDPNPQLAPFLLAHGANPDLPAADGEYPLHRAATRIDSEPLTSLLTAGADVHVRNANGHTALHIASTNPDGCPAILTALLSAGSDLAVPSTPSILHNILVSRTTPRIAAVLPFAMARIPAVSASECLLAAALLPDAACARSLLELHPSPNVNLDLRATLHRGNNALMLAARRGHACIVALLLPHLSTEDVDSQNAQSQTALHLAILSRDVVSVTSLLSVRSRALYIHDAQGRVPLMLAVSDPVCLPIVHALVEHANTSSHNNNNNTNNNTNTNTNNENENDHDNDNNRNDNNHLYRTIDSQGNSILHHAVSGGDATCIRFLLEHQVGDRTLLDRLGWTPFMKAVAMVRAPIVKLFLEIGCEDLERRDRDGQTVLMLAVARWSETIVTMLLDVGADLESVSGLTEGSGLQLLQEERRRNKLREERRIEVDQAAR